VQVFRRKQWKYLILDEAHNIKNFKSQRWQILLNFNAQRRLLLTGTPLQNDLMELWSLMHFLMPHIFRSHSQFKVRALRHLTSVCICHWSCWHAD
jgi:SNF2 family DNA or RNA helicase